MVDPLFNVDLLGTIDLPIGEADIVARWEYTPAFGSKIEGIYTLLGCVKCPVYLSWLGKKFLAKFDAFEIQMVLKDLNTGVFKSSGPPKEIGDDIIGRPEMVEKQL